MAEALSRNLARNSQSAGAEKPEKSFTQFLPSKRNRGGERGHFQDEEVDRGGRDDGIASQRLTKGRFLRAGLSVGRGVGTIPLFFRAWVFSPPWEKTQSPVQSFSPQTFSVFFSPL